MERDMEFLSTEKNNPSTWCIDQCSTSQMLQLINAEDRQVPLAVQGAIPMIAQAVDGIVEHMRMGGRLFYIGAGTSGRLGVLDASECPPTFGTSPELVVGIIAGGPKALSCSSEGAEDDEAAGKAEMDAHQVSEKDSVVGIAASGRTPFVMGALQRAREIGAFTTCLCNTPHSALAAVSDVAIEVVTGPEVIMGSTRMKAGTAQKMVLNMISTCTMIQLGKVYYNYMVDLNANNEKLYDRSVRMVCQTTGVTAEAAQSALQETGGSVKTAICMLKTGLTSRHASTLLREHNGVLRAALKSAGG